MLYLKKMSMFRNILQYDLIYFAVFCKNITMKRNNNSPLNKKITGN